MGCPLQGGRTEKKYIHICALRQWGLRASCCGEWHEVQVRTGTECPGVRMYLDTTGAWRILDICRFKTQTKA